ncbi:MAG: hypothetical protein QXE14_01560, partial [Candidatus Bathyarchaeia archaeon]
VESFLPLSEVNLDAIVEVGFKGLDKEKRQEYLKIFNVKPMVVGPRLRNLHTWFARRPCSTARVLTLASVVRSTLPTDVFLDALGFGKGISAAGKKFGSGLLFYAKPNRMAVENIVREHFGKSAADVVVCDPMAGGGSIPLEALRLGFRTVAVEYNPVAYLVLRASVEFPAKYADSGLFEETLKATKELTDRVRAEIERYYGERAKRYIFARGVRCPFCNGLIPIQGIEPAITFHH